YKTVEAATGKPPIAYTDPTGLSIVLVFGPGAHPVPTSFASRLVPYPPAGLQLTEPAMTDDWPFLYLAVEPLGLFVYVVMLFVA
ncbi:hypothetical protein ABTC31_20220, partial [Acinetobacter baumannii]